MEIIERSRYYLERAYPYVLAGIITFLAFDNELNYVYSSELSKALDACNTIVALIIGFLGAILPVILGMKNESKIVKYVFERDKNRLFLKYIKSTIFWGLITLAVTITLYLVNDFSIDTIAYAEFYIWIYLVVLFLALTYRSLKNMLDLVFLSDDVLNRNEKNKTAKERIKQEEIEDYFDEDKLKSK